MCVWLCCSCRSRRACSVDTVSFSSSFSWQVIFKRCSTVCSRCVSRATWKYTNTHIIIAFTLHCSVSLQILQSFTFTLSCGSSYSKIVMFACYYNPWKEEKVNRFSLLSMMKGSSMVNFFKELHSVAASQFRGCNPLKAAFEDQMHHSGTMKAVPIQRLL